MNKQLCKACKKEPAEEQGLCQECFNDEAWTDWMLASKQERKEWERNALATIAARKEKCD